MLAKALVDVALLLFPLLDSFTSRQDRPARHVSFGWRAYKLEDANALVDVRSSFQNGFSLKHLTKDAAFVC